MTVADAVRCRFAPAPSGSIHVGNARSALFSWLFARHNGGAFVLRVEDTDASRVSEEAFHGVIESLRWLGLDWDEGPDVGGPHGPYRQSQRSDVYREQADRLIAAGHAYRCYCTAEELKERKDAAVARGEQPGYDGRCRTLTDEERAAFEGSGRSSVIRFAMPEREWVVDDLVKGEVRFPLGQLRDFVLVRSDGSPVFLLAVAVDDMLMGVTHVIRGDDLLGERTAERRGDRGAGRDTAAVRAPPAGPRYGRQAAVQAPRLHVGRGLPRTGLPARGAHELPGAPGLVQGRIHDVPVARRADPGVRPVAGLQQPGGVRHDRSSSG